MSEGAPANSVGTAPGRQAAGAASTESEGRLAAIFANASVGLCELDAGGRFLRVNHELCRIVGRSPEDLLQLTIADVTHPDDLAKSIEVVAEVLATGRPASIDKRYRRPDGTLVWASSSVTVLHGIGSNELLVATTDLTERRRMESALLLSEARFREFAEKSSDALWIVDAQTGRLEYLSPAFERIWGEPREPVMADLDRWLELVHPDDRESAGKGMPRLLAGERFEAEYRIVRADGSVRWILDSGFPMFDDQGRVARVGGIAQDFTQRRLAEDTLRDSERRFRTLSEGIPQLVWRAHDYGLWAWASPQWTAFTGQSSDASRDRGWIEAVHPEDRDAARAAWEATRRSGVLDVEFRIRHAASGAYRWFQTRALPVREEGGAIVEWLGTCTDIDDLRASQAHQATLLSELQHRVRNTLAVLRSIARRTAENSDSVEEMSAHLQGRIGAFSRVQSAITRAPGAGVELGALIAEEMVAHLIDEGERLSIKGPPVLLATRAAETLSLAVHELATNAVKYGALASSRGRIRIAWAHETRGDGEPWLAFRWTERALDEPLSLPDRRGFGLELFERTLTYDLGAEVSVAFPPDGAEFAMAVPMGRVGAT